MPGRPSFNPYEAKMSRSKRFTTIQVPVKNGRYRTVQVEIKPKRRREAILARLKEKYAMLEVKE